MVSTIYVFDDLKSKANVAAAGNQFSMSLLAILYKKSGRKVDISCDAMCRNSDQTLVGQQKGDYRYSLGLFTIQTLVSR